MIRYSINLRSVLWLVSLTLWTGPEETMSCHQSCLPFISRAPWPSPTVITHSLWFSLLPEAPPGLPRARGHRVVPRDTAQGKTLGSVFHLLTHTLTHSFQKKKKKKWSCIQIRKMFCLKKKKSRELRTRAGALSLSVKLQPNYCLLRGAVKHNQSESLKDTISLFTNCLLVNSESPPCFKSTNHRAVMNSNWFSMQCCKTKSHRILFLMATVIQLHNKS